MRRLCDDPRMTDGTEQVAAIAAACARLGVADEWIAEDGYEHAIVGAAVEGSRVAWVERRSRMDGGYEDIDYYLRARVGDERVLEWIVDTYNPYFGCDVGFMRWFGERVAIVYREKHDTIVAVVDRADGARLREIDDRWRVAGDLVLTNSRARGLVEVVRLPDLARGAPLPRAVAETSPAWFERGDPRALRAAIVARLGHQPLAGVLAGALAYRFWADDPPPSTTYDQERAHPWWNPPSWLPFYWHATLPPREAAQLLARLDELGGRDAVGVDVVGLACAHVAARCRELAAACRAGKLPEETYCYFWAEWSQRAIEGAGGLFPAEFWELVLRLRPQAARLQALTKG